MRYLLDTHALLWFVAGDDALPDRSRTLIASPAHEMLVSAASAWEVATKFRIGKLPGAALLARNFVDTVAGLGFAPLAITAAAAQRAGGWEIEHRDPFDRILAAQAELERVPLITNDAAFAAFGVQTVW